MNVGALKKMLEGVDDRLPVLVHISQHPDSPVRGAVTGVWPATERKSSLTIVARPTSQKTQPL